MSTQDFKTYFGNDYQGAEDFNRQILIPLFGKNRLQNDMNEYKDSNDEAPIHSIRRCGEYHVGVTDIQFFDVTLEENCNIHRAKTNIQKTVRRLLEPYSGAFIVFHYVNTQGRTWRFSWVEKLSGGTDSTSAKRCTYLCGNKYSCRTIADRFYILFSEQKKSTISISKAFDVEALSEDFFKEYKVFYEDIVQYICGKRMVRGDFKKWENAQIESEEIIACRGIYKAFQDTFGENAEKAVRDYVKKLLGRLVFIQFLQKKGWLGISKDEQTWQNGDVHFLSNIFKDAPEEDKDNFIDNVLEKILFESFNKPNSIHNGIKYPYLNGGLFERDAADELSVKIPRQLFVSDNEENERKYKGKPSEGEEYDYTSAEGLFQFFERYNFTIDENDPDDAIVGVDPEMLGKIFENLLEDNKDKGAFYTPKEIVQYMCRESLIAYLTNCAIQKNGEKFPREKTEEAVRQLIQTPERIVPNMKPEQKAYFGEALRSIKICDPAIGSGAFPMGLLNELVHLRIAIGAWADKSEDVAALKKEIIQNNIYGVDIEQGAIDIARLRFWLSIMVDIEAPEALPNFDYKFMRGDSLITTFGGKYINLDTKSQVHFKINDMKAEKQTLYNLKKKYFESFGEEKQRLAVQIKKAIIRLISMQLGYESRSWAANHAEQTSLFEVAHQLSFADVRQQLPPEKQRIINLCEQIHRQLDNQTCSMESRAHTDIQFFDWRIMFTEVFDNDNPGFDIVIGNPPFIDSETMTRVMPELRELYAKHFSCAKGNWDMFVLFIELGMRMLDSAGVYSFIIPNKLIAARYTEALRAYIANNTIFEIRDYGNVPVFTNAAVYPATIVGGIGEPYVNSIHFAVMENVADKCIDNSILTSGFANIEFWDICFQPTKYYNLFSKINRHPLLKNEDSYTFISAATVSEAYLIKEVLKDGDKSCKGIRMVNTGTIDKYSNLWGVSPMQYIKGRYQYPIIEEADLAKISQRRLEQAKSCKIIVAGMSKYIEAIYDDGNTLAGKSTTIILGESNNLKFLLAILNSNLASFFMRIAYNSLKMAGGFINVGSREMENIPIPETAPAQQQPIIDLVDAILAAKRENPQADTTSFEAQIDQLVYKLYDLSGDEIKLIENN